MGPNLRLIHTVVNAYGHHFTFYTVLIQLF